MRGVCDWSRQYHCHGAIHVSYRVSKVLIRIEHDEHHVAVYRYTMSGFEFERVADLTKAGMSTWQIISKFRWEGSSSVLYNDVNNMWIQAL